MQIITITYGNDNRTIRGTVTGANSSSLFERIQFELYSRGVPYHDSHLTDERDEFICDAAKFGVSVAAIRSHVNVRYVHPDGDTSFDNYTTGDVLGYFIINPTGNRTYEFEYTIFAGINSLTGLFRSTAITRTLLDPYYTRTTVDTYQHVLATTLHPHPLPSNPYGD
jgi:hypothetical protein